MKVVQINSVCGSGSTGKICVGISKVLWEQGIENYILYCAGSSDYPYGIRCTERFPKMQALRSRILGNYGFNSQKTTQILIAELERIEPDVVHLHNLHGHNCNLEMLMAYFREKKTRLVWTFHDCWTFTGYCAHYDMYECDQWKTKCQICPQRKKYSWFFDRSSQLFCKKIESFSDLNVTIITPSKWLSNQVKQSFLRDYKVNTIYNGIDLSVFFPRNSSFRKRYNLEDKFVILGVAFGWGIRKGLDVFVELSKRLDDRSQIVLVGTDEKIDRQLPSNIISIHRTHDQSELAEIYSAADVFVNPTREEVLGLTNIEALACGTPVITFESGGSPECIDTKCGYVVPKHDVESIVERVMYIMQERPFTEEDCVKRARLFEEVKKYNEYVDLYFH